jgi:hypothetical protein
MMNYVKKLLVFFATLTASLSAFAGPDMIYATTTTQMKDGTKTTQQWSSTVKGVDLCHGVYLLGTDSSSDPKNHTFKNLVLKNETDAKDLETYLQNSNPAPVDPTQVKTQTTTFYVIMGGGTLRRVVAVAYLTKPIEKVANGESIPVHYLKNEWQKTPENYSCGQNSVAFYK